MAVVTAEIKDVNGVTLVCETVPFFKSVSFGVWILSGSRDEPSGKNGVSHFLEHLVFKGSKEKNAGQIAMEIDELGGDIDAYTSRETTCFSGHVVSHRLEKAFSLVSEMIFGSVFPEAEMELERKVILEELKSSEDNPSELAFENAYQARFGAHPLGAPLGGIPESVAQISRDDLVTFRREFYTAPRMVVAASGDVNIEKMEEMILRHFGQASREGSRRKSESPAPRSSSIFIKKDLEQAHLVLAVPGIPITDSRRDSLALLNLIFGGSFSSRLFQKVREQRGLAYSIQSFTDKYSDSGVAGVYTACAPESLGEIWKITKEEMESLASSRVDEKELDRAKVMAQDGVSLSMESLESRVSRLAGQVVYHGRIFSLDETLERIKAVTAENVRALAGELFSAQGARNILVVGPESAMGAAKLLVS